MPPRVDQLDAALQQPLVDDVADDLERLTAGIAQGGRRISRSTHVIQRKRISARSQGQRNAAADALRCTCDQRDTSRLHRPSAR